MSYQNPKKAAANDHKKVVGLMGANVAKQCIEAGLLDELHVHIAPFLLGDGIRLFQHLGGLEVELERIELIASLSGVTHLGFKVRPPKTNKTN
jgi:dihydrofolate reductase